MFLGQFVPVSAMGVGKPAVNIMIEAPTEILAYNQVPVTLIAQADKRVSFDLTIRFPKSFVTGVGPVVGAEKVVLVESADYWEFRWVEILKKGETSTISFSTLLNGQPGFHDLMSVTNGGLLVASHRILVVEQPKLQIRVTSPTEPMIYGSRPFTAQIFVYNPATIAQAFDISVEIFMNAIDRNVTPVMSGGNIYDSRGDPVSLTHKWNGIVPAGSTYSLALGMATGIYVGTRDLLEVRNLLTGQTISRPTLSLILGTDPAYGEFEFRGLQGDLVHAGDMMEFRVNLYSPTAGQFILKIVKSTDCVIEGLPAGANSYPNLTYVSYRYYVTLAQGPASGTTCHVTGSFYNTSNMTLTQINGQFELVQ